MQNNTYKKTKRPVLKIPYTISERFIEIVTFFAVLINILLLVINWNSIPGRIPTHFNFSGNADAWGSKGTLMTLPVLIIILYVGLSLLAKIPHMYNYPRKITEENAYVQYQLARQLMIFIKTEIVLSFSYIEYKTVMVALGRSSGMGGGFALVFIPLIFGTIGYYIYRTIKQK